MHFSLVLVYWKYLLRFYGYFSWSEPHIRGTLMGFLGISTTFGLFTVYLFGAFIAWRQVAVIATLFPVCALIGIIFIYDSPMFYLSKQRADEGLKSLQFYRGWTSPQTVYNEFNHLKSHSELSRSCSDCVKSRLKCYHPEPSHWNKLMEITQKKNLKPMFIMTILNILNNFSAMFVMRPFVVQILRAYGMPFDATSTTIFMGVLGIVSNVVQMLIVRRVGKRNIYLYSLLFTFLGCLGLCS